VTVTSVVTEDFAARQDRVDQYRIEYGCVLPLPPPHVGFVENFRCNPVATSAI
jgi:hypothetical protein